MKPTNQKWNFFFTDTMNGFCMSLTSLPNQTPEQEVAKRYIFSIEKHVGFFPIVIRFYVSDCLLRFGHNWHYL